MGQLVATTLIMVPIVVVIDKPWQLDMPRPSAIWSIVGLAILSTALAYVIFFRLLARRPAR